MRSLSQHFLQPPSPQNFLIEVQEQNVLNSQNSQLQIQQADFTEIQSLVPPNSAFAGRRSSILRAEPSNEAESPKSDEKRSQLKMSSTFTFQQQNSSLKENLTIALASHATNYLLHTVLEAVGEGFAIISEYKKVLYQNNKAEEIVKSLGYSNIIDFLFKQNPGQRKSAFSMNKRGEEEEEDDDLELNQDEDSDEDGYYKTKYNHGQQKKFFNLSEFKQEKVDKISEEGSSQGDDDLIKSKLERPDNILISNNYNAGSDLSSLQKNQKEMITQLDSQETYLQEEMRHKISSQQSYSRRKQQRRSIFQVTFEEFVQSKIKEYRAKRATGQQLSTSAGAACASERMFGRSRTARLPTERLNQQQVFSTQDFFKIQKSQIDREADPASENSSDKQNYIHHLSEDKFVYVEVHIRELLDQFAIIVALSDNKKINNTTPSSIITSSLQQHSSSQNSNLKLSELQEATQELKRKLVHCSCHELRTPLNFTLNTLSQLADNNDIALEIRKHFIEPALCSSELMLNIVENLEDYYALDTETFRLKFCVFNLEQLLKHCISLVVVQAEAKNIEIIIVYDKDIPENLYSDPDRLKQVVLTLLCNSIKLTSKGHIKIEAELQKDNKNQVLIEISDTGSGLSKQVMKTILKNQSRIDSLIALDNDTPKQTSENNQDKNYESQGSNDVLNRKSRARHDVSLGLQIVSAIIKGMTSNKKLKFTIESKRGQGCKYSFFIQNWDEKFKGLQYKNFRVQEGEWEQYEVPLLSESLSYKSKSIETVHNAEERIKSSSQLRSSTGSIKSVAANRRCSRPKLNNSNNQIAPAIDNQTNQVKTLATHKSLQSRLNQSSHIIEQTIDICQTPAAAGISEDQRLRTASQFPSFLTSNVDMSKALAHSPHEDVSDSSDAEEHAQKIQEEALRVIVVGQINLKSCNCPDILCVDDDPFNLRVLTQTLTKLKFVCHEAHDGEQAVQMVVDLATSKKQDSSTCKCSQYALIFMDIDMPRKNGFQASKEIQKFGEKYGDAWKTVICAHSAFLDSESEKKARRSGMTLMLPKPSNNKKLKAILQKVFPMYQYR